MKAVKLVALFCCPWCPTKHANALCASWLDCVGGGWWRRIPEMAPVPASGRAMGESSGSEQPLKAKYTTHLTSSDSEACFHGNISWNSRFGCLYTVSNEHHMEHCTHGLPVWKQHQSFAYVKKLANEWQCLSVSYSFCLVWALHFTCNMFLAYLYLWN